VDTPVITRLFDKIEALFKLLGQMASGKFIQCRLVVFGNTAAGATANQVVTFNPPFDNAPLAVTQLHTTNPNVYRGANGPPSTTAVTVYFYNGQSSAQQGTASLIAVDDTFLKQLFGGGATNYKALSHTPRLGVAA